MPNTGFQWGDAQHCTYNDGTDVDGIAVADGSDLTTDEIDNDTKAFTNIGVKLVEDDSGSTDGTVDISILGKDHDPDGETYQDPANDDVFQVSVEQSQNTTHVKEINVPASAYPAFKVHVDNGCGQEVDVTLNYIQSDVPAAS